jgi:hypothetical protein
MQPIRIALGITNEHLQAIGTVAVQWSILEDYFSKIIINITNMPLHRALTITTHLNERTRMEMCTSLAHQTFRGHPPELELKAHTKYIDGTLYPKRNEIIHGCWGAAPEKGKIAIMPVKARGVLKVGPVKYFTAEDIESVAAEIEEAHIKLDKIRLDIFRLLPTLSGWP